LYVNQGGRIQRQLIADGEVLGIYGVGVDMKKPRDDKNNPNFANIVDFSFGYAPITSTYPEPSPGTYVVQTGDTLQSIAQGAYGDSALWYRIAEANGLVTSTDLKVGQTLNIPNRVSTIHNNDTTFKPYDPSRITGDLTPNLPMPESGCGGVGQLLMMIVTIVVAIYTAGAIAGVLGTATAGAPTVAASTFGTGLAALAGGSAGGVTIGAGAASAATASVAGAVVGGAAGSIAGQAVGLAAGVIDKFSWKNVALSAVSSGVTAGVGAYATAYGGVLAGQAAPAVIGRAIASNVLTQGISVAVGLQKRFDWRGVAASGIGVAVGRGVGEALGEQVGELPRPAMFHELGRAGVMLRGAISGFTAGAASAAARGGRMVVQQVVTDAFGNALGSSRADASNGAAVATGDPLGEFIDKNMPAWERRQAYFDQVAGAFSNPGQIIVGQGDMVAAGDAFTMGKKISVTERGRTAYIDADDLSGLSDAELMSRAKALVGGSSSGGRGARGSREWNASVLYQQGLGDIREYSTSIVAGPANGGGDLSYPLDGGGTLVGQRIPPVGVAAFGAAQDSPVKQLYNELNERLSGMVDDAQDQYVQNGAQSSGWRYGFNAAGYVASEFFPRSVGAAAFVAIGGPIVGRVVGWGSRAAVSAFPMLGREVGAIIESGLNRVAVPRGGVSSTNPSLSTLQPPVRPVRPNWRVSEMDLEALNGHGGYRAQASFLRGLSVSRGARGSTRPDLYKPGESIDIKNYNLATAQGQRNLVRDVVDQAQHRAKNLPAGDVQKLVIDARGQNVSTVTLNRLSAQIQQRSDSIIVAQDVQFWR
jgi:hypothetical protein